MFVRSQVDLVPPMQLTKKLGPGVGNTVKVVHYAGSDVPNKPVNVSRFDTIYTRQMQEVDFEVPCIYFDNENGRIVWRYPPTEEGIGQRDADYNFIMHDFSIKCPKDVGPSAQR